MVGFNQQIFWILFHNFIFGILEFTIYKIHGEKYVENIKYKQNSLEMLLKLSLCSSWHGKFTNLKICHLYYISN